MTSFQKEDLLKMSPENKWIFIQSNNPEAIAKLVRFFFPSSKIKLLFFRKMKKVKLKILQCFLLKKLPQNPQVR